MSLLLFPPPEGDEINTMKFPRRIQTGGKVKVTQTLFLIHPDILLTQQTVLKGNTHLPAV